MPLDEWIGPVYMLDRRITARSRWLYFSRVGFLSAVLVGLAVTHFSLGDTSGGGLINQVAQTGSSFYNMIVCLGLAAAVLFGPPMVVGSICRERARGHFDLCLASGISPARIVWGKILARLWPVLGTMASIVPVLAVSTLLGGVDPTELGQAFGLCCSLAVLACCLSAAFAFRTNKPHEALVATYLTLLGAYVVVPFVLVLIADATGVAPPLLIRFMEFNPIWACFADMGRSGATSGAFESEWAVRMQSVVAMLALAGVAVLWASFRLRVSLDRSERSPRQRTERGGASWRSHRDSLELDKDPVRFRERRRQGSRWMRRSWIAYHAMSLIGIGMLIFQWLYDGWLQNDLMVMILWFQIIVGFLLLASVAPTSFSEERAQGSLDVLIATPLTAREIVMGKWRAARGMIGQAVVGPLVLVAIASIAPRDLDFSNAPLPNVPTLPPALVAFSDGNQSLGVAVGVPAVMTAATDFNPVPPTGGPSVTVRVANSPNGPPASIVVDTSPPKSALVGVAGIAACIADRELQALYLREGIVIVPSGALYLPPGALAVGFPSRGPAIPVLNRIIGVPLLLLQLIPAALLLLSLGMWLAVVLPRPGSASSWTVGILVVGSLLLAIPSALFQGGSAEVVESLGVLSPITMPETFVDALFLGDQAKRNAVLLMIVLFAIVSLAAAGVMLAVTIRSLDVGLGRARVAGETKSIQSLRRTRISPA